ncbi:MAG: adenylate/guanylate cyclase domain-containing protein [Chloroflexota bacterium]
MNERSTGGSAPTRRSVTVLFADVVGSTGIGERLDPELLGSLQARMFAAVRPVIERHGGTLEKFIGDAVMAVFGVPLVREDDALRAARAALDLAPAIALLDAELQRRLGVSLRLRVGLHSGEVVAGLGPDALVTGDAVNVAARLEAAAEPGSILLSAETLALLGPSAAVRPVGPVAVRGRSAPVVAHELLGVTGADPRAHLDGLFVGRQSELAALRVALAESAGGSTRLVTVLAPAGVGKSRLVRQLMAGVGGDVRVLRGRCLPYGDGITWWPLGGALRDAAGLDDEAPPDVVITRLEPVLAATPEGATVLRVLASLLGVNDRAATADDIAWAMRRLLGLLAAQDLVCLVIEDIHWAEPPLLDLLETLVDWSPDLRLLIVCPARPELLDARPGWGTGRAGVQNLVLDTLAPGESVELLSALPGGGAIPASVGARILASGEGNPLYLEELVAGLRDRGLLVERGDGWVATADLDDVHVPPTVAAVVAARIDGLPPAERRVAEHGAVIGRVFERGAVAALAAHEPGPGGVGTALLGLSRRSIVRPDGPGLRGDDAFRFRHILLRDAAYARIPKGERAALHDRFARWLIEATADAGDETVPVIAHHLATAVELRLALDPLAGDAGDADEAVLWLRRAIERARRLQAWSEVGHLADRLLTMTRFLGSMDAALWLGTTLAAVESDYLGGDPAAALARLDRTLFEDQATNPAIRARLLERISLVRRQLGDEGGAFAALDEALAVLPSDARDERGRILAMRARHKLVLRADYPGAIGDARLVVAPEGPDAPEPWVASALTTWATAAGESGDTDTADALFARALPAAETSGDPETIIRVYHNRAVVLDRSGRLEEKVQWTQRALARASELGLDRSPNLFFTHYGLFHHHLLIEADAVAAGQVVDRVIALGPTGEAGTNLLLVRGVLAMHVGDLPAARSLIEEARVRAERSGSRLMLSDVLGRLAGVLWFQGDLETLERVLAEAWDVSAAVDIDGVSELVWVGTAANADRAVLARRTGNPAAADRAVAEAFAWAEREAWVARHDRRPGTDSRARMLLLEGELARAEGRGAVGAWRRAIAGLDENGARWYLMYARYRLAEALVAAAADPAETEAAILDAEGAAAAAGAEGILARIRSLSQS